MSELIGKELPSLEIEVQPGGAMQIPEALHGKWSILYLYPKDDTPGCTKQACTYQENLTAFTDIGAQVFGVSADAVDSHAQFQNKFNLSFPLLADTDRKLIDFLGSYREQEWQGKKFMGVARDTILVDPEGKIAELWRDVHPVETIAETLAAVKAKLN